MLKTIFLFLFCFSFCASQADIRTIHSIEELSLTISKDALVFVDLGYTTQYPASPMIARNEARSYLLDKTSDMEELAFKKLSTLLLAKMEWKLVEPGMKDFIASLQEKGIATLGITGGGRLPYIGKLPYMPSLLPMGIKGAEPVEQYYVQTLLSLGIDFTSKAPMSDHLEKSMQENRCVYQNGVLFLCHQSMGDIIPIFYRNTPQKYAKVVAIDDEIFYLRHLEETLAKENIPFEGYYYVKYAEMTKDFDQKLAEIELDHLIKENTLLSDEEASQLGK